MTKRQVTFSVRVSYATPIDRLDRCIIRLREMLREHEGVHDDTIMVHFDVFADSYYNLFLTSTQDHRLGGKPGCAAGYQPPDYRSFAEEGVEFAYPGQNGFVKQKNQDEPVQVNGHSGEKNGHNRRRSFS